MVETRQLDHPSVNFREPINKLSSLFLRLISANKPGENSSLLKVKWSCFAASLIKALLSPTLITPNGVCPPTLKATSPLAFLICTNSSCCALSALNTCFKISAYNPSTSPCQSIKWWKRCLKIALPLLSSNVVLSSINSVSHVKTCERCCGFKKNANKEITWKISLSSAFTVLPTKIHSGFSRL